MPTERQRQARSANAKEHSTGPRGEDGKKRSSRNAVKHGGYATPEGIRTDAELGGYLDEIDRIRGAIEAELEPATALQTEVADLLAASFFQTGRLAGLGAAMLAPGSALGHLDVGQLDRLKLTPVLAEARMYLYHSEQAGIAAEAIRQLNEQPREVLRQVAAELVAMGDGQATDWPPASDHDEARVWRSAIRRLLKQLELTPATAASALMSRSEATAALARTRIEYAEGCASRALLDRGVIENMQRTQLYSQRQLRGLMEVYRELCAGSPLDADSPRNELTGG